MTYDMISILRFAESIPLEDPIIWGIDWEYVDNV